MNIFYKILAKYSPKRTILKIFSGEHAPEPPLANAWREAPCKYPHFYKKI